MSPKCSRRLAGYIVIEALLAAAPAAAGPAWRAGLSFSGPVTVLAIEDSRGVRALFARCDCAIPQSTADFIAARLIDLYQAPRETLVLAGAGSRSPRPDDFVTAAGGALSRLAPAILSFSRQTLSIVAERQCLAALSPDGALSADCAGGVLVTGAIHGDFKLVDLPHGLQRRSDPVPTYPVQAVAFGRRVLILALGGDAPSARFRKDSHIVVANANGTGAFPDVPAVGDAIRQVIARVSR